MPVNEELPVLSHWISGAEASSSGDRIAPVFDPARGIETKHVALANGQDIEAAISSAQKAFPAWRDLSVTKRQQIIFRFRELLNERKGELAQIITAEHGKWSPTRWVKSPAAARSSNSPPASPT